MKNAALLLLVTLATTTVAQDVKESDVSPATRRYRDYRLEFTEPPFALAKVKAIIKAIKPKDRGDDSTAYATSAWGRMATPERFTYSMIHGEVSSQVCDVPPWIMDEEHKIFGQITGDANEESWSDRQSAFAKNHRKEYVRLLRATIHERGRAGVNLKQAIITLGAYELIPDLVKLYERDQKDQDILTVLALLMKDGRYPPFLKSITYHKFYGPDANYGAYIVANAANQKLMIDRGMAFYRSRVG